MNRTIHKNVRLRLYSQNFPETARLNHGSFDLLKVLDDQVQTLHIDLKIGIQNGTEDLEVFFTEGAGHHLREPLNHGVIPGLDLPFLDGVLETNGGLLLVLALVKDGIGQGPELVIGGGLAGVDLLKKEPLAV